MAATSDTKNYTFQRGICYFNEKDSTTGLYKGSRDLGNAPALTTSATIASLPHYSSRGGLKKKDFDPITEIAPTIKFTLEELNADNTVLSSLGTVETITQVAGDVVEEAVVAIKDRYTDLSFRNIGNWVCGISAPTDIFIGTTVTGAGGGSATLLTYSPTGLTLVNVTGTWTVGETITCGTETATLATVPSFNSGYIKIQNATKTVTYIAGTDYSISKLNKDDKVGRFKVLEGSTMTTNAVVTYSYEATTYKKINMYANANVEGEFRFISRNAFGPDRELRLWRVSLKPDGDVGYIGEEYAKFSFTGEVLSDEENHPNDPYGHIIMEAV